MVLITMLTFFFNRALTARQLPTDVMNDIKQHKCDVDTIINYILKGAGMNQAYDRLVHITDTFGHRLSGSKSLEDAIDYVLEKLEEEGLDNVHGEKVKVPDWRRGNESLAMIRPRFQRLPLLGLGFSPNTTSDGITAEIVVVTSFEELHALEDSDIQGKIVVYNHPFINYDISLNYRENGTAEASRKGAVAVLVRSLTDYSDYTVHAGRHNVPSDVPDIPTASITVENANLLQQLYDRGERVILHLKMEAQSYPCADSRNIVAEITGSELPDEVVMFGGHIDSWDVGTGALDDGGGIVISWQVLSTLKALGLRPKRTLRLVMWTAEEPGSFGAQQYYEEHKHEAQKISLAMESDFGVFRPYGLAFSGSEAAAAIMEEILALLESINTTKIIVTEGGDSDTKMWGDDVPKASLLSANDHYFRYHHSNADTVDVLDTHELDLASILWTVAAYVVADLDNLLPRYGTVEEN